ncbi:MAG: DUF3105 domain-containing protein [Actinomycetota bacterium]
MAGANKGGRGANDPGRRPTKAERRDEARREREQIQRQMARRRRNRSIGLVLIVVAVVVVVVAVFVTSGGGGGSGIVSAADLLKQAPAAEKSAGCTAVQTTANYQNAPGADPAIDHEHIGTAGGVQTPPQLSSYTSTPPASGPHDPTPLPAGIYGTPPSVYSAIHSLEHGAAIIWYAAGTSGSELDKLKAFYGQSSSSVNVGQDRIIIAPYDYPDQGSAGQLPNGVQMALVSWHRLETCSTVSLAAAFDFTSQYEIPVYDHRPQKGVAREPGVAL